MGVFSSIAKFPWADDTAQGNNFVAQWNKFSAQGNKMAALSPNEHGDSDSRENDDEVTEEFAQGHPKNRLGCIGMHDTKNNHDSTTQERNPSESCSKRTMLADECCGPFHLIVIDVEASLHTLWTTDRAEVVNDDAAQYVANRAPQKQSPRLCSHSQQGYDDCLAADEGGYGA